MRLENILSGLTIPGIVPQDREHDFSKQLTEDHKLLFVIQNLVGEIIRLEKLVQRIKGHDMNLENLKSIKMITQSEIARHRV